MKEDLGDVPFTYKTKRKTTMPTFKLPYSREMKDLYISDRNLAGVLESKVLEHKPAADEKTLVRQALYHPIESDSLENLSKGKGRITIITSDHTRPVPSHITMPILLERIRKSSPDAQINILIATGYHRAMTIDEQIERFGKKIVDKETILVHDSRDERSLAHLGTLPSGGELWINKAAVETDLLIAEGFIEPHFFAGFSGGRKSILPGIAGYKTVLANHCSKFIASDKARTGNLEENPIHVDMLYAAEKANLAFILNVIINDEKEIIHAVAGHREKAHQTGCEFLEKLCQVDAVPAEIVVTTNGGYPLDQNIYQSVKGMTAAEASCKKDGVIVMVSACNDGHGGDSFYQQMAQASEPKEVYDRALKIPMDETVPDQWEYQILSRILIKYKVILVTDQCDAQMIKDMHMEHTTTVEEAMNRAFELKGKDAKVTVIPNGVGVIVQ